MKKTKGQTGFTLMEIVVATTIFTVVFSALLTLFNYTLRINRRSEALRQATQGMRNFVENLVKEIRNGQVSYGVLDPGATQLSPDFPIGPCTVPVNAASAGVSTYSSSENKLALVNTDSVEECIFFADANGNYAGTNVFSTSTGGTLVLQKNNLAPEILNTSNIKVEQLLFRIRPTKDPYVLAGGYSELSPVVSIFLKFTANLPTGENVPIYYQTSVATNQYDIPNQ